MMAASAPLSGIQESPVKTIKGLSLYLQISEK